MQTALPTADYPERWGGSVRIVYRSGEIEDSVVLDPKASAVVPPDWDTLERKQTRIAAASAIDAENLVQSLLAACRQLGRSAGTAMPDLLAAVRAAG